MSATLHQTMTFEEFLAWEDRQELRYEFDGVRPVAMTGGTASHAGIQVNLAAAMTTRLRGTPFRYFGSELKVDTSGKVRYPDGFVLCGQVDGRATIVREPVVIFEVLSKSTTGYDRIVKNREYEALPSVRRYVMLEQNRIGAMVFSRADDKWIGQILEGEDVLAMPEIGIEVPLTEIYEGIEPLLGDDEGDANEEERTLA